MEIEEDRRLDDPELVAFLEAHVQQLREVTPPGSSHALDLDGLRGRDVTFWVGRDDNRRVLATAALKRLDAAHAELKSMRTAPSRLRQGLAATVLGFVLDRAREAGYERVSLETGSFAFFAPARALYARHGFVACEPFGAYRPDPNSVFLTRVL